MKKLNKGLIIGKDFSVVSLKDSKGCWYGEELDFSKSNSYLSYRNLVKCLCDDEIILNNEIFDFMWRHDSVWEIENGLDYDEETDYSVDVYQYFTIDSNSVRDLKRWTDEIVYYNDEIDMYLLGVTHLGTSWDCVNSDILLVNVDLIDENEAHDLAVMIQSVMSENGDYSYWELGEITEILEYWGEKFELTDEFKENGLI